MTADVLQIMNEISRYAYHATAQELRYVCPDFHQADVPYVSFDPTAPTDPKVDPMTLLTVTEFDQTPFGTSLGNKVRVNPQPLFFIANEIAIELVKRGKPIEDLITPLAETTLDTVIEIGTAPFAGYFTHEELEHSCNRIAFLVKDVWKHYHDDPHFDPAEYFRP
jgi:hypothetical protein